MTWYAGLYLIGLNKLIYKHSAPDSHQSDATLSGLTVSGSAGVSKLMSKAGYP
jgi:hypothetical protein